MPEARQGARPNKKKEKQEEARYDRKHKAPLKKAPERLSVEQ